MKILELRFKNLNSLYGEWVIDFTDPEYVSNGIFALTGPTGAGKSTILDAICLALYGSTPRLGRITSSGNEIMSRQTGDCYSEVIFESQAGRFRCHWEQRRARKSADGNLQDQEHEIAEADTGRLVESKKSLVVRVIEEKTGMDFDRFNRSVLLAQGNFDAFLKAGVEEKSKILEQITGTEIYSEISIGVHKRQRDEQEVLRLLKAEISGIEILEPEQEKEFQDNLSDTHKQEKVLGGKLTETGKAITWLTKIEDLKQDIRSFEAEEAKLKNDTEAFKPERSKLEQATKAATLDGVYATFSTHRKHQLDDETDLRNAEAAFAELESSANKKSETLKSAEKFTQKAKEELKTEAPLIQDIQLRDQRITEQTKDVSEGAEACTKEAGKIRTDKEALAKEQAKRAVAGKTLEDSDLYLKENARDEWLISGLAGVEEQLRNLISKQREIAQKESDQNKADSDVADAEKKMESVSKQCGIKKQALDEAVKNLQKGKDAKDQLLGGKLLREYHREKEELLREMASMKFEGLEELRAKLEDGKPCLVCGASEHPFAEGNIPDHDEIEQKIEALTWRIDEAEKQEIAIKKLEQVETAARKYLNDSEKLETEAANAKKVAEKTLVDLKDVLTKLRSDFAELKLAVSGKLKPLGITEIPETEVESLLDSLRSRLKAWRDQVKQKTDIEKQISAIDSEAKRLDAVIDMQVKALAEKQISLERLKKELADGTEERKQLYGDKNPDNEAVRLNKAIADAEKAEKKARELNADLQQELTKERTRIDSLNKRIKKRRPELKEAEADFSEALAFAGFVEEKAFLEARLSREDRDSLFSRAKELEVVGTELNAKLKDRKAHLDSEIAETVTDKTLEELKPQFEEFEESLKTLRDAISGLKHKLRENKAANERIKEKESAIEAQEKECDRWIKLHGLIGSADGKKYRNFAQGLTFELMVSHANQQLKKMTDRYLLIRDDEQPLNLNVLDNYQAGEIRSIKNLSGGESFIVSLALALGLSKMSSRNVRVDSLFLDEGFGTLDEESLETALETLSSLHQDGKLIGIISHIPALKERIGTQINIAPVSGGRSSISGPGCKKVVKSK